MKKLLKTLCVVAGGAFALSCMAACADTGKKTVLAMPAAYEQFDYDESQEPAYKAVQAAANSFAAQFTQQVYALRGDDSNFSLSPVSVYMALALASQCAGGDARTEVLSALGVSQIELEEGFGYLYRSLNCSYPHGRVTSANSIWLQDGLEFISGCLNSLAEDYYCYSYAADFRNDNEAANNAVRHFVREQTDGLIDKSFDLVERTCFALVNTLYFKDNWLGSGDELSLTQTQYDFETSDGQIIRDYLMQGAYQGGVVQHGENFATFYTSTDGGNRLYFIVPDEGHTLREVFGGESISFVTGISDWGMAGEDVLNYTRCIFPAFSADYDGDVRDVLKDGFGVEDIFNEDICSLTSLLPDGVNDYGYPVYCSKVQHVAKLVVDRRGVEGAAVTVIPGEGAESADPAVRRLYDFVVDRSFGYVLTDRYGTILFTGVVNTI